MYEDIKIGIIGGDTRQVALAHCLSGIGFETALWGVCREGDIGKSVRCSDWHSAVAKSSAVILPLPASIDGVRVNAPYSEGFEVRMSHLIEAMAQNTLLIGGKFDFGIKEVARENNITLLDYFECEDLQIKNSVPTAEGAIEIALREMPITLFGSKVLICGYGRIGKVLARLLENMGASVFVAARKSEDLAWIDISGYNPLKYATEEFIHTLKDIDVIFNTVPYKVIDKSVIEKLSNCSLIIDLASGKGGVDFDASTQKGIKAIHALSLPGKVAPITAGKIVCECVLELLIQEGVIERQ